MREKFNPLASRPGLSQQAASVGAQEPCRTQPPSCSLGSPSSPAGLRLRELEAPGEKAGIHLFPHSPPDDRHSTDSWLNGTSNGCRLWEEPTRSGADQWLSRTTTTATTTKSLQSCPTVRPHRRQPTRLPCPQDSPGKNTGVGCHCLLQCMKVKSESEVAQSCPTPSDPMDSSLPGSSVHGIFQARVLE